MLENAIEWVNGSDRVTVTFSQKKYINSVLRLAEKDPEAVEVVKMPEDNNGYLYAHIDIRCVRIAKRPRVSEEAKKNMAENFKKNLGR